MRVEQIGEGDPEVAIVGGIHGDEPCGVEAIERLLAEPPGGDDPVQLIVANERAIEEAVRYTERDLNRSFPGDPESDAYEERLAAEITEAVSGRLTLALHSTQSSAVPFMVVDRIDDLTRVLAHALSVHAIVDTSQFIDGRLFASTRTIEVECGLQGSAGAAEAAERLSREYIEATATLAEIHSQVDRSEAASKLADYEGELDAASGSIPAFRLVHQIEKAPGETYDVTAENFEEVPAATPFAAIDGDPIVAEEAFYPVLLSARGYETVFGYAAELVEYV